MREFLCLKSIIRINNPQFFLHYFFFITEFNEMVRSLSTVTRRHLLCLYEAEVFPKREDSNIYHHWVHILCKCLHSHVQVLVLSYFICVCVCRTRCSIIVLVVFNFSRQVILTSQCDLSTELPWRWQQRVHKHSIFFIFFLYISEFNYGEDLLEVWSKSRTNSAVNSGHCTLHPLGRCDICSYME